MKPLAISALYITLSIQTLSLISFGGADLKIYHIAIAILALLSARKLVISKSLLPIYAYLIYILLISLPGYLLTPPSSLYINYIVCIVLCVSINSFSGKLDYEQTIVALQHAALAIAVFTAFNSFLNMDTIRAAQAMEASTGARPEFSFMLYGGGVNLEASWIALAGAFFLKNRKLMITYLALSLFIDYCMLSRAGFIATMAVFLFFTAFEVRQAKRKHAHLIALFTFAGLAIPTIINKLSNTALFQRFANIGNEPGSVGRLNMWQYFTDAFLQHPFLGHGAGNAITAIQQVGFTGLDGNIHNYILHNLLEFGILGLALWLWLALFIIRIKHKPELTAYFVTFSILSLIQFRGAEPLLYFIITILITSKLSNPEPQAKLNS